jgi:hypothetical protein
MTRDDDDLMEDSVEDGTIRLRSKYKLLFGTESIYIFLRLFNLLCLLLTDSIANIELATDPAFTYHNPQRRRLETTNIIREQFNVQALCSAIVKVLRKEISFREYVNYCRKVTRDKVHQLSSLPKLIDICYTYLVRVAREDALLQVYDYCQHAEVNPEIVRYQCLSVIPEASYRIQYDVESKMIAYCYIPQTEVLLTKPKNSSSKRGDSNDIDDDVAMTDDDPTTNEKFGADAYDTRSQVEEENVEDSRPPSSKRVRLR